MAEFLVESAAHLLRAFRTVTRVFGAQLLVVGYQLLVKDTVDADSSGFFQLTTNN
jgi:hypothetical protein